MIPATYEKKFIIETLYWIWTEDRLGMCRWQDDLYIDAYRIAYSLSVLYPEDKLTDYEWFCNKVTFLNTGKGKDIFHFAKYWAWNDEFNSWHYETEKLLYNRIKDIKEAVKNNVTVFKKWDCEEY